jgi:type II secretion system protein G
MTDPTSPLLPDQDSAPDIGEQIRALASDKIEERDKAARTLVAIGEAAIAPLKELAKDKDPEISKRVQDVLHAIDTRLAADIITREAKVLVEGKGTRMTLSFQWERSRVRPSGERVVFNKHTGSGELLLKQTGKMRLTIKAQDINGKPKNSLIISDGQNLHFNLNTLEYNSSSFAEETHPSIDRVAACFARAGCLGMFDLGLLLNQAEIDAVARISGLKRNAPEAGGQSLSYVLTIPGRPDRICQVKLAYNPANAQEVSRTITWKFGEEEKVFTETMDKVSTDIELVDDLFAIPNEKLLKSLVRVHADLMQLRFSLEVYKLDNGDFPSGEQGLAALLSKPTKGPPPKNWKGPYAEWESIPKDPWSNPYSYRKPGERNPDRYDVFSAGPDGKPGTADDIFD